MKRSRLIVIGPLPPPLHGVTISTSLVLANKTLREHFEVEHLDTSDHRSLDNIGRWGVRNLMLGLGHAGRFCARLRGSRGVVYLPISQGAPGFLRDSLFIHLARLAGWRVALHLRGGEFRAFYRNSHAVLRAWIRCTLRRVASVAVMGPSLREELDGLVPPDRIAVVPNGAPDLRPNGVARDPETVLFLSNLRRRKGVVESVDAALQVLRDRPSARFLFVGEWEEPQLERKLRERAREVGDSIVFLGAADGERKRELLLSSSVFLFPPTEPEGHPRAVLDALSAGLPVVTTSRGAIADTVGDGEAGYVLPDSEPTQLADRTLRLLNDSALREQMSRAARKRYLEHFTQERADQRLSDWLRRIS